MTVMSIQKDEGRPITHPQHEGEGKDTEGTGRMHDKLMFGKDAKALWGRTHFWVSILEYLLCGIDPKSESYRIMWCNHHWDIVTNSECCKKCPWMTLSTKWLPHPPASNPAAAATQTATPIRVARRVYFLQSPSASTKECPLLGKYAVEFWPSQH